jgi:ABC transporter substrate binding protein
MTTQPLSALRMLLSRHTKRREFISLLAGAAAGPSLLWPLTARAQQDGRIRHVMVWIGGSANDPTSQQRAVTFRETMRGLGWIDGHNVKIDVRFPTTNAVEETRAAAAELAALNPDVIVTTGAPILGALHRVTKTVPIVFTLVTDPVTDGFVASLARPGGNITGFTIFEHSFAGKWLEMLKEVVPGITRVAVMQNPDHPALSAYLRTISAVASGMGVEVTAAEQSRRNSSRNRSLRSCPKRRPRPPAEPGRHGASRVDCQHCAAPWPPLNLFGAHVCNEWRSDVLRHRC